MKLPELILMVFTNLNRMRGRVIMTMMGVIIGTAAIVILISLATGLQASTVDNFSQFGSLNQITVFSGDRFGGETSGEGLTPDVIQEFSEIDGVEAVTPLESMRGGYTLKYNRLEGFGNIIGIDPEVLPEMGFQMEEGSATLGAGQIIVGSAIGDSFAEGGGEQGGQLPGGARGMVVAFAGQRPQTAQIGGATEETTSSLNLNNQSLQLEMNRSSGGQSESRTVRLFVSGVLASTGGQQDYNIYMSMKDLEALMAWSQGSRPNWQQDGYSQLLVIAEQDADVTLAVTDEISNRGYFTQSTNSIVETLNSVYTLIEAVLAGIASIALLVAAIGIANTMIMSVLERTREIGLMKAVGARNRDVMAVFISEAGAIGLLGGVIGVIVGIIIAQIIGAIANSTTGTSDASIVLTPLWLPVFAILFGLFIGLVAGVYPAFRAVQLDPVKALKFE